MLNKKQKLIPINLLFMKMKNILKTLPFAILGFLISITSCKKEDSKAIPTISTIDISSISDTSAQSGGKITSNGHATVTEKGVCWSTNQTPSISDKKTSDGKDTNSYKSNLTGLEPNTKYYLRAYATNEKGTGYGEIISFTTNDKFSYGSVIDNDGNTYKTIVIGSLTWMAENLRTSKYNDGSTIPNIQNANDWNLLNTGAQCDYDNSNSKFNLYGKIYNFYAVNTGKLCPTGWHIPNDDEWLAFKDSLIAKKFTYDNSSTGFPYNKLAKSLAKATGWSVNDKLGSIGNDLKLNNRTGFSALPGGFRTTTGIFMKVDTAGYWWSSSDYNNNIASYAILNDSLSDLRFSSCSRLVGLSVRCLKD
jgi:uncharacterized protein (TIGR02145 family)